MLYKPRTKIRYYNCVWKQFKLDFISISLIATIHDVSRCDSWVHGFKCDLRAIRNAGTSRASRRSYKSAWQQYNFFLFFSLYQMLNLSFSFSFFFRLVLHEPRHDFSLAVSYSLFFAYPLCTK